MDQPTPKTRTFIDLDITLACGKEFQHTVCPEFGDAIDSNDERIEIRMRRENKTGIADFIVRIKQAQIAVLSRCERVVVIPEKPFKPEAAKGKVIPINADRSTAATE